MQISKSLKPNKDKVTSENDWIRKMKKRVSQKVVLSDDEVKFMFQKILNIINK